MKYLNIAIIISICLFFLSGCNTLGVNVQSPGTGYSKKKYHKHGPPPHAPAHGYRHKHHDGHEFEYDSKTGAYIVLNVPETYFGNNLYIRLSTYGDWMVSTTFEGGWRVAVGNEVPYRLKKYKGKKKSKKGKGQGYSKKTHHKHGPPPHAPAHGYRHKHYDGHELEYDSKAGAYIVLNVPETYFGNNLYIRLSTYGDWMVSSTLEGGWHVAVGNEVPYSLKEYKGKKKSKKGKGHKKNKYGYDD